MNVQGPLLALLVGALLTFPGCADDAETAAHVGIEPNPSPKGDKDPTDPNGYLGPDASGAPGDTSAGTVGAPATCVPECDGRQCGPDGCGGACGWCASGWSCQDGACVDLACEPECVGQMIGAEDGCGGICTGSGLTVGLKAGGAQNAAWFRSQVMSGTIPAPEDLPLTGWINEHGATLPPPLTDRRVTLHAFAGATETTGEPLVTLQLGLNSGIDPATVEASHFNLVVVVDVSASMASAGQLDYAKAGLVAMLDQLDPEDLLSIVAYSSTAEIVLAPTPVADKAAITAVIESLHTKGGTNLWAGLEAGYQQAEASSDGVRLDHVLLLSDGLTNEGETDPQALAGWSAAYNAQGVGLTSLGLGADIDFDLLYRLAAQAGGNFYFLDSPQTLSTVFADEITWLMTPLADQLEIWFTLPEGLGVQAVYGFEYEVDGDLVRLLGPSPVVATPDAPVAPAGPVAASSTLHASKEPGLVIARLTGAEPGALADLALTTVGYRYRWVATGETETFEQPLALGPPSPLGGAATYVSEAAAQRGLCVLRAGLAMRSALTSWHDGATVGPELEQARAFCAAAAQLYDDPQLEQDLTLMDTLREHLCGPSCN